MVRVCIIGSGLSGLASIKSCLEAGLEPHCYEVCKDIGGLWNYNESKLRKDGARLYSSLITNLSKEMMSYSDFPLPAHFPMFLKWHHLLEYLNLYAEHFNLKKHIKFQQKVLNVQEIKMGNQYKWRVVIHSKESGEEETQDFDKVIIAVGQTNRNIIPSYDGEETFKGKILHSAFYDSDEDFTSRNVLVVGPSHSGCDVAAGVGETARNTYLSSRSGVFMLGRLVRGYPAVMMNFSRFKTMLRMIAPEWVANKAVNKIFNQYFDHKVYGLQSHVKGTSPLAHLIHNDDLPLSIATGKVVVVPEIEKINGRSVHLVGGKILEDIDVIFSATGYGPKFPFISGNILPDSKCDMKAYKWIFPLNVSDPSTIAMVGVYPIATEGRTMVSEIQSRFAAYVMAGHIKLPTTDKMMEWCHSNHKLMSRDGRFGHRVLPQSYSVGIAKEIGVYPYFFPLLLKDPKLAWAVFFGPSVPHIYRIVGRNNYPQSAREYISNTWNNCVSGLNVLH